MRLVLISLLLVSAAFSAVPTASAHQCAGMQSDCVCPLPADGKTHQHSNARGETCQGVGGGPQQDAGPDGASQTPGPGVVVALLALTGVALFARRRK